MCLMQEDESSIFKRLRRFNAKEPVKELKLNIIIVNIERIAPIL